MTRRLYRLIPRIAPTSWLWQGRTNYGVVLVRAGSDADARLVAAQAERERLGAGSPDPRCVFLDDQVYDVQPDRLGVYQLDGLKMVVTGTLAGLGWAWAPARSNGGTLHTVD
ncbi:hypothetical protein [Pelagibacterium montanilacus]|uniref:hypothetical protein n=1 Tax=Pelagibacterium montanilacus TaxID=2185280 RepID=UPI000F8F2ADA|nr:hypothetical protein [Pelagibacterium montanilacus]